MLKFAFTCCMCDIFANSTLEHFGGMKKDEHQQLRRPLKCTFLKMPRQLSSKRLFKRKTFA